jgi:hypothetical protein
MEFISIALIGWFGWASGWRLLGLLCIRQGHTKNKEYASFMASQGDQPSAIDHSSLVSGLEFKIYMT